MLKHTMLMTINEVVVQCGMMGLVILARQESHPDPDKPHDMLTMV